jgi:hypothetical protein
MDQEPEAIAPDAVEPAPGHAPEAAETTVPESGEAITEPAKVMRIGSMVKQLLDEVRSTSLDEASRERLAEVYERSITELSAALSPSLQEELHMLALVGWLEGLFHGIQASLMAQQLAARQQLEHMRQLPGAPPDGEQPQRPQERPGTYL